MFNSHPRAWDAESVLAYTDVMAAKSTARYLGIEAVSTIQRIAGIVYTVGILIYRDALYAYLARDRATFWHPARFEMWVGMALLVINVCSVAMSALGLLKWWSDMRMARAFSVYCANAGMEYRTWINYAWLGVAEVSDFATGALCAITTALLLVGWFMIGSINANFVVTVVTLVAVALVVKGGVCCVLCGISCVELKRAFMGMDSMERTLTEVGMSGNDHMPVLIACERERHWYIAWFQAQLGWAGLTLGLLGLSILASAQQFGFVATAILSVAYVVVAVIGMAVFWGLFVYTYTQKEKLKANAADLRAGFKKTCGYVMLHEAKKQKIRRASQMACGFSNIIAAYPAPSENSDSADPDSPRTSQIKKKERDEEDVETMSANHYTALLFSRLYLAPYHQATTLVNNIMEKAMTHVDLLIFREISVRRNVMIGL